MGKHGLLSVALITLLAQITANTVANALPSSPRSQTNAPNSGNSTHPSPSSPDSSLSVELLPQSTLSSSLSNLLATDPAPSLLTPALTSNPTQPTGDIPKLGQVESKGLTDSPPATLYLYQKGGKEAVTVYLRDLPLVSFVAQSGQEQTLRRASALVARLNQLAQGYLGDTTITLEPPQANGSDKPYRIKINHQELLSFDRGILLEAESNYESMAVQATNRLRRLLLNAPPIVLDPLVGPDPVKPKPTDPLKSNPTDPSLPTNSLASRPAKQGQEQGYASWYDLHASREELTAAHRTLPIGTKVQVTNLDNGQQTTVRIADRGPFLPGRIIDVSIAAARSLGMLQAGVARVRLDVLLP